jgi:hypothetical protein
MKQIQPIGIWKDGTVRNGSFFSLLSVYDNLVDRVSFWYEIKDVNDPTEATVALTKGNIDLTGNDYTGWDGTNVQAYVLIAGKLNLSLV